MLLTIQTDLIAHRINVVEGFEVDYNPITEDKDFNNNGTWGKIVNHGAIIMSFEYDPDRGEPNFGKSDYELTMTEVKAIVANLTEPMVSIDGDEPITLKSFIEINTAPDVEPIGAEEIEKLNSMERGDSVLVGFSQIIRTF